MYLLIQKKYVSLQKETLKHNTMDKIYDTCDKMASGEKFVSLKDVVECYLSQEVTKLDSAKEYQRLKRQLNRMAQGIDFIEYKNGIDLKDGFRYKKGFEYFFSNKSEKAILRKLEGNERKLFLTGGLQMLFDGDSSSQHLIELECISDLHNLDLVKILIKYVGKRVISFRYNRGFRDEEETITFHPHLLKEYNSRWFMFGYENQESDSWKITNIALDRIVYDNANKYSIKPHNEIPFKNAPKGFYHNYFKDIIGVTRLEDGIKETITIQTKQFKVHHLLRTKPIHPSQRETKPFDIEKQEGEFTIQVIPNIELQTRILSYGPGVQIISEGKFQDQIRNAIMKMNALY